jgi:hypothetical protein
VPRLLRPLFATLVLAVVTQNSARSEEITSEYTTYNVKQCDEASPPHPEVNPDFGGEYVCKGFKADPRYDVTYSRELGSDFVAFGPGANLACSGQETLGNNYSPDEKIEWRLKNAIPFATIQRWQVDIANAPPNNNLKDWLIVTKLEPNTSCHLAFVEAGVPDSNKFARTIADSLWQINFECKNRTPIVIAMSGTDTNDVPAQKCDYP